MKKYFIVGTGSIFVFILSIFAYLYFFQLVPIQREQTKIVAEVTLLINEFQNCLELKQFETCEKYADNSLAQDMKTSRFIDIREKVDNKSKDGLRPVYKYFYNSMNRLVKVQSLDKASGSLLTETSYDYDPTGRRIRKQVTDTQNPSNTRYTYSRYYVYSGESLVAEYSGNGVLLARYTNTSSGYDSRTPSVILSSFTSAFTVK